MHPSMYLLKKESRMPEEFYSPQILSSSYIARRVFHQYNLIRYKNNQPLVEYKMASKNPRNQINTADSLEAMLLTQFNNDTALKKFTGIMTIHGEKHLVYARPFLRVEPQCLKCHGKKEDAPVELRDYYKWESGFNLKVGEIPAVEIIKTPLRAEYDTITGIGIILIAAATLFILLIILYSRLSIKNKIINLQKREIENNLIKLKEAQNQLVENEKMASLGVLTAGVAHEINNPLNFIYGAKLGLENFFNNKAPQYIAEVSMLLDSLSTGVERATDIVRGLNRFSRSSSSFNDDCNIHSIIENSLLMLENSYKDRINIEKEFFNDEIRIKGNEGKLHQVFINVFTNSIQSIKSNGFIKIKTEINGGAVDIFIFDNGCGIAKDNIPKVIEPFFTTKAPGEGTGLGLSIVYNILKEHKGHIEFDSNLNEGTTVKITIPIARVKNGTEN